MTNLKTRARSYLSPIRRYCQSQSGVSARFAKLACVLALIVIAALLSRPSVAQNGGPNGILRYDPVGEWINADSRFGEMSLELGDYPGVPLNDAARYAADSYDGDLVNMPELTCKGHSADHAWREGPTTVRIWAEVDNAQQIVAYHTFIEMMGTEETIYMDGRPHPPDYAPYTWAGFSTGKWEGDILAVTTDHLKNNLLKWNGIPRSEKATLSRHFMRHGNYLTMSQVIYDPAYLTEPWILSLEYRYSPGTHFTAYPCEEWDSTDQAQGAVPFPNRMPGTNPFVAEYPARHGIPPEAARGGAETMYPEYIAKMKTMKKLPRPAVTRVKVPSA